MLCLSSVFTFKLPIYCNSFPEIDEPTNLLLTNTYVTEDSLLINREERMGLDNTLYSFILSNILIDLKVTTTNALIDLTQLCDKIYTVDMPRYLGVNPQCGQIPGSLINYLNKLNCLTNNKEMINNNIYNNIKLQTKLTNNLDNKLVDFGFYYPYFSIENIILKEMNVIELQTEDDPVSDNLKRKLWEIIIKESNKSVYNVQLPSSLQQFSFPQVVQIENRWYLKVNLLNFYLRLISPCSLFLDLSSKEITQLLQSILEIQSISSLNYSNYFFSGRIVGRYPEPSWTIENYERFMKDRKEYFNKLQLEYPGELYYILEMAKLFEFQDNVALLSGHLSLLKVRTKFTHPTEKEKASTDENMVAQLDIRNREYHKTRGFIEREICKMKVEKYFISTCDIKESDIRNIVKKHYSNLPIIVKDNKIYKSAMLCREFIFGYKRYLMERMDKEL
ncbi:hypothetical protein ABK040_010979 [Willaertia magna]